MIEAVKQLSSEDKLKINDAIWKDNLEILIEHQRIVLDRITKAKLCPERLLD